MEEMLGEVDPSSLDRPLGKYTLELFDDYSGDLKYREVRHNYITPLWEKRILSYQHLNEWFGAGLAHSSTVYRDTTAAQTAWMGQYQDRIWNPRALSGLPISHLILTNDDTAEDPDDAWLKGVVTGYASRIKSNIPAAGLRGQVNESESQFTNNGNTHRTVWDFTTQQANGPIRTLAIGSMENAGAATAQAAAIGPQGVWIDSATGTGSSWNTGFIVSQIHVTGSTAYWLQPENLSSFSSGALNASLCSCPVSELMGASFFPNDPYMRDARGATVTTVGQMGGVVYSFTSSGSAYEWPVRLGLGLTRVGGSGTDFVTLNAGSGGSGGLVSTTGGVWVRRYDSSTLAPVYQTKLPLTHSSALGSASNVPGVRCGLVSDGTWLYGSVPVHDSYRTNILRIDPSDGSINALLPLPYQAVCTGALVLHDGDLFVPTNKGVLRMTTSGTPVSPYGYGTFFPTSNTDAGLDPWPTTSYGNGFSLTGLSTGTGGFGTVASGQAFLTDSYGASPSWAHYMGLFSYNNRLWVHGSINDASSPLKTARGNYILALNGANMFSRTRLDSLVTKNSSQNMKITYELTWPTGSATNRVMPHPII